MATTRTPRRRNRADADTAPEAAPDAAAGSGTPSALDRAIAAPQAKAARPAKAAEPAPVPVPTSAKPAGRKTASRKRPAVPAPTAAAAPPAAAAQPEGPGADAAPVEPAAAAEPAAPSEATTAATKPANRQRAPREPRSAPILAADADAVAPVTEAVIDLLQAGAAPAPVAADTAAQAGDAESDAPAGAHGQALGDAHGSAHGEDLDEVGTDALDAIDPGPQDAGDTGETRRAREPRAPRPPAPAVRPLVPAVAPPLPSGLASSRIEWVAGDRAAVRWRPGAECPDAITQALQPHLLADGNWPPQADGLLPQVLRQAAQAGHTVQIDAGVWSLWAAHRDARSRAAHLQSLYPQGPDGPALRTLLAAPLAPFQAEGALWAVVAGRGLLADAPGLGKGVQALAAAQLWRRHFGVERVLVLCPDDEALAWVHAWRRLAGVSAQVQDARLPQASDDATQGDTQGDVSPGVRIVTPAVLAAQAQALADWAPQLLIVDEPQRLSLPEGGPAAWGWPDAPHQLVLCGAPLEQSPELLDALVDQLDPQRLGPLAALRQVRAAGDSGQTLADDALEAVSDALSRTLLQRQVSEVREQLPDVLWHPRWFRPDAAQRQRHGEAVRGARRDLRAALAAQHLADADQWRLSQALVAAQAVLHRPSALVDQPAQALTAPTADPAMPYSPELRQALDAAVAQALQVVRQDADALLDPDGTADAPEGQASHGRAATPAVVVLTDTDAQAAWWQAQGSARFGPEAAALLRIQGPNQPLRGRPAATVQVGAPWCLPPRGDRTAAALPQRRWAVMAEGSTDMALWDTVALRDGAPRGPAEPGGCGFLAGDPRNAWLLAITAWLDALDPAADH